MPKLRHCSSAQKARRATRTHRQNIRLLGFDDNIRQKKKDGVIIKKCEVKHARNGNKLEVMLGKQSEINDCNDKFIVSQAEDKISCLTELHDLAEYTRVNARIKVLDVASPQTMQGGKTIQNVVIADENGYTKLTLWEEHVGYLQPNKSDHLKNILLRVYSGERYLATAKHDSSITEIQDLYVRRC